MFLVKRAGSINGIMKFRLDYAHVTGLIEVLYQSIDFRKEHHLNIIAELFVYPQNAVATYALNDLFLLGIANGCSMEVMLLINL